MSLLTRAGSLAKETDAAVYLVGGIVRDILLQRPNLDIDLVVEGDGPVFAAALAAALEGTVVIHDRFGTSVVILPGKRRVDVATARKETYRQGGALPDVIGALLRDDLGRRDFTINAMAVSLNPGDYGELIDYYDGREDMARKRVRVLHHASFVDDPTRVFRAVRFEKRFGFAMTKETENLLRNAVADDLLKTISGTRIRNEVMAVFGEEDTAAAVTRLQEFGVWKALNPGVTATATAINYLTAIPAAEESLGQGLKHSYKRRFACLAALLTDTDAAAARDFCRLLCLGRARTNETVAAIEEGPGLLERLSGKNEPAGSVWLLLKEEPEETLVYLYAAAGSNARTYIRRFSELRTVKPFINGRDLMARGHKPSAYFADALADTFRVQIDGGFATKEAALRFAEEGLVKAARRRDKTGRAGERHG